MAKLSRRKALQLSGSGLIAGLAGCNTIDDLFGPDLTLGELGVSNLNFRPHTVSVLILDDNEPVYYAEMDASAAEPEPSDASDVKRAGGGLFEGVPTAVEDCVLYAWRDGQPSSQWENFDFKKVNTSCIGVYIKIEDSEQTGSNDVSILYSTSTNSCEDRNNRDS